MTTLYSVPYTEPNGIPGKPLNLRWYRGLSVRKHVRDKSSKKSFFRTSKEKSSEVRLMSVRSRGLENYHRPL